MDYLEWNVDVCLEEPCKEGKRKSNRCVDILINLYDNETRKQKLIAIENKVTANAADAEQFSNEYCFLRDNKNYKKHAISMVFMRIDRLKEEAMPSFRAVSHYEVLQVYLCQIKA